MLINSPMWIWGWRVLPVAVVVVARIVLQIQAGYFEEVWLGDLILILGWFIGWLMADADHIFYAVVCSPQELTCQRVRTELGNKNFLKAWRILQDTADEREKLPIRNMLTAIVMTGVGFWIISSGGSLLAAGTTFGFAVRLFSEILPDRYFQRWYWVFSRKFEEVEHKGIMMGWGVMLLWQMWTLIRG